MRALATTRRIMRQLRNDPRTVALLLVVPSLPLTLLYYVFRDVPTDHFDRIGPIMLAILPMMLMFVVTSVVMLRERTPGTPERLLTTPLCRWNLIASHALVFGLLAVLQAAVHRPRRSSSADCWWRRNAFRTCSPQWRTFFP